MNKRVRDRTLPHPGATRGASAQEESFHDGTQRWTALFRDRFFDFEGEGEGVTKSWQFELLTKKRSETLPHTWLESCGNRSLSIRTRTITVREEIRLENLDLKRLQLSRVKRLTRTIDVCVTSFRLVCFTTIAKESLLSNCWNSWDSSKRRRHSVWREFLSNCRTVLCRVRSRLSRRWTAFISNDSPRHRSMSPLCTERRA